MTDYLREYESIIRVHSDAAAALRAHLGCREGDEASAVTLFVQVAIEHFRAVYHDSAKSLVAPGPRWPSFGDDERVLVGIMWSGQRALNHFLYHDWGGTGIGFSEFIRRAIARETSGSPTLEQGV